MAAKPNIYDVARLAEVSHQTVSRVINDSPKLRPETRKRVQDAMRSLGFVPNAAARALVTSRTKMVGILITDSIYNGPAGMLHAMQEEARNNGYFSVTVSVDPTDAESITDGLAQLRKLGIEGLLVITPQSDFVGVVEKAVTSIPVVYLDTPSTAGREAISVDNYQAARAATAHLISLGHTNLLHISGPQNWFDATTRRQGFLDEARAAGVAAQVVDGDWSIETGRMLGERFDLSTQITAIFAANDHLALGLLSAFSKRGIRVPQDVSVIGFDDIPEAAYFEPPLTTMHPNFAELGRVAMGKMLGTLNEEASEHSSSLVPELIVRKSTAQRETRDN